MSLHLKHVQSQISFLSDPHMQAKMLYDLSKSSNAPTVPTAQVIDFLFTFLQQHQQKQSFLSQTVCETAVEAKKPFSGRQNPQSDAVIVQSIVKGLHYILQVKPAVVEPMIQITGMEMQLTKSVSTSDDFKLRCETLRIVFDCLLRSKEEAKALEMLLKCMHDANWQVQEMSLLGLVTLFERDHAADVNVTSLLHSLADLLLFNANASVQRAATYLLKAMAENFAAEHVYCEFLHCEYSYSVPDAVFLLFGYHSYVEDSVRAAIVQCIGIIAHLLSMEVVEGSLQRSQMEVGTSNVEINSVMLATSGFMLNFLEDRRLETVQKCVYAMARILEAHSACKVRAMDRCVAAALDALARFANSKCDQQLQFQFLQALVDLMQCRNARMKTRFVLRNERLSCILGMLPSSFHVVDLIITLLESCDICSGYASAKSSQTPPFFSASWPVLAVDQEIFLCPDKIVKLKRLSKRFERTLANKSIIERNALDGFFNSLLLYSTPKASYLENSLANLIQNLGQEGMLDVLKALETLPECLIAQLVIAMPKSSNKPSKQDTVDWTDLMLNLYPRLNMQLLLRVSDSAKLIAKACKTLHTQSVTADRSTKIMLLKTYGSCCILMQLNQVNNCGLMDSNTVDRLRNTSEQTLSIQRWIKNFGDPENDERSIPDLRTYISELGNLVFDAPDAKIIYPIGGKENMLETHSPYCFELDVRFALKNMRDTSRIHIKTRLWDGSLEYHKVPRSILQWHSKASCSGSLKVAIPVPSSLDPIRFELCICSYYPIHFTDRDETEITKDDMDFVQHCDEVECFLVYRPRESPNSWHISVVSQ